MYDYGIGTLEKYGLTAEGTSRTRGAVLCRTQKGLFLLREYWGSEKKLAMQQLLLKKLSEAGYSVDLYLENQEGQLITKNKDDIPFTLQYWYEGRECDTKSKADILESVRILAVLHTHMCLPAEGIYQEKSLKDEYLRHNQELRKIRKFIRKNGAGSAFEKEYLANVQWFLERAEVALGKLQDSDYEALRQQTKEAGWICHGEYNQHNVLILKKETAVTNFGHFRFDVQVADLYRFMRKILEKYNWDPQLGKDMLKEYDAVRRISPAERENLKIRFLYPEKYWKLANYYFSHNKAWISEKNVEKQRKIIEQKEIWADFTKKAF